VPVGAFLVVRGSEHFALDKPVINIGRRLDNHLVLSDPRVSRKHAQIRAKSGQYFVIDLHSSAGTLLNGERVEEAGLKPGDVLTMATVEMIYGEDTGGPPDTTPPYAPPFKPEADQDATLTSDLSTLEMEGKTKELGKEKA
jgi:pSer/pThr/pTyr-binding forkhead associated (FHA) protein